MPRTVSVIPRRCTSPRRVHIGFHVANSGQGATPESIRTLAVRVDALGYNSLWVSDHVIIPSEFQSRYPYPGQFTPQGAGTYYEPLITLAVLAGATERVHLGTSVLVVPQRNPVLTAKQFATLSALAGGRVIVGVGVGWLEEEFRILGAGEAFAARGAVTDDYVRLYRALWSPDPVEFGSAHYNLPRAYASPKPPTPPPIWVGGNTRPALRRTARIGDGWHAIRMGVEDVRQGVAYLVEQLRAGGRSPAEVLVSLRGALHFDRSRSQEWELGPSAAQAAAQMERYRQAGVQAFIFSAPPGSSLAQTVEVAERFMSEVRPKLGE